MGIGQAGQDVVTSDFKGLLAPVRVIEMGRPDVVEGRPGQSLVDAVRAYDAKGGFKSLAGGSADAQAAADAPDPRRDAPSAAPSSPGIAAAASGPAEDAEATAD